MFFVLYDKNLIDVFCIHMWNNDLFVAFSLVLVYEIENLECLIVVPFFAGKKLWRERGEGVGCISPTWVTHVGCNGPTRNMSQLTVRI